MRGRGRGCAEVFFPSFSYTLSFFKNALKMGNMVSGAKKKAKIMTCHHGKILLYSAGFEPQFSRFNLFTLNKISY